MENYNWGNFPMTNKERAMLLYVGQQLQKQGVLPNKQTFTDYQHPNGFVGPQYAQVYPKMNDDNINFILDMLKNKYQPAINARSEFNQHPQIYKDHYNNIFDY